MELSQSKEYSSSTDNQSLYKASNKLLDFFSQG